MSMREQLRERAAHTSAVPGLVSYTEGRELVWTWAELAEHARSVADAIASRTSRPERTVLVAEAEGRADDVLTLIGMLCTGLPVAVMPRNSPQSLGQALRETLLGHGYDLVDARESGIEVTRSKSPKRGDLPAESLLMASGGSSGRPKIVVDRRMRTIAAAPRAARPTSLMNWHAGQRQLVVGALHHASTLGFFIEGLADGNTLIVPHSFDPATALSLISAWQVHWLHLTPYHMRHLAFAMEKREYSLASLRGLVHLAAPCPHSLKRRWLNLMAPECIFELYGSTEGIGITIARGDEWMARPGTAGRGFFTHVRILDADGIALPAGEEGEIYMRSGLGSLPGHTYLDANDTIKVSVDGFSSVGDRGHLDDDGYLYVAARQLTRIQVGGETVDPSEVESVLIAHPSVLDAGVVGVPDERLGESLVALVVSAGHDASSLRRYLREKMAAYKVPRAIHVVDHLPYTEIGKLDRAALAECAALGRVAGKQQ
jgi:bile acid-coenzyme A ligase